MTKRGLKPTGIAIFEAQGKGFASVGHYVQVACSPALPWLPLLSRLLCWCDVPQPSRSHSMPAALPVRLTVHHTWQDVIANPVKAAMQSSIELGLDLAACRDK